MDKIKFTMQIINENHYQIKGSRNVSKKVNEKSSYSYIA